MDVDGRDAAWEELYRVLPHGWTVMRPVWREDEHVWAVYARNMTGAGRDHNPWREAFGETEEVALRALAQQLRNLRQ